MYNVFGKSKYILFESVLKFTLRVYIICIKIYPSGKLDLY